MNYLLKYFEKEELEKIKKIDDLYLKAQVVVSVLFKDKFDKSGEPYIGHLYRVSDRLSEPIEKVAALLHDTVEDTDVTYSDLLEIGFPLEIIEIVKLVTKNVITKGLSEEEKLNLYDKKIDEIIGSGNVHAINLKEADISDNSDQERLKKLSQESQEWFHKKYDKQLIKLRNVKGMIK